MISRFTISETRTVTGAVKILWQDGHQSLFHNIWLRDNCLCNACGQHASGTRLQRFLEIPDDIHPATVQSDAGELKISWANDGHLSIFNADWLRDHCYSDIERIGRRPKQVLWDNSLKQVPTVSYPLAQRDQQGRHDIFRYVREYGFVLLLDVGIDPAETERLAEMLGYIRVTHFGRVFELKNRPDPKLLADIPGPLLPHTDDTYRHVPLGINILHCIKPSADGGGATELVDSFTVAARLKSEDPETFARLSRTPIRHERNVPGEILHSHHPVFTHDCEGNLSEVRLNERTMTALSLPEHQMEATYHALRKLFRIAYDKSNRITIPLQSGQALVFDNLRVLHGRTTFKEERLIRQIQVMRDEFYGRLAAQDYVLANARV